MKNGPPVCAREQKRPWALSRLANCANHEVRIMKTGAFTQYLRVLIVLLAICLLQEGHAATTNVNATPANTFSPPTVSIKPGDTVQWTWTGNNHSTTSTSVPSLWDS